MVSNPAPPHEAPRFRARHGGEPTHCRARSFGAIRPPGQQGSTSSCVKCENLDQTLAGSSIQATLRGRSRRSRPASCGTAHPGRDRHHHGRRHAGRPRTGGAAFGGVRPTREAAVPNDSAGAGVGRQHSEIPFVDETPSRRTKPRRRAHGESRRARPRRWFGCRDPVQPGPRVQWARDVLRGGIRSGKP